MSDAGRTSPRLGNPPAPAPFYAGRSGRRNLRPAGGNGPSARTRLVTRPARGPAGRMRAAGARPIQDPAPASPVASRMARRAVRVTIVVTATVAASPSATTA